MDTPNIIQFYFDKLPEILLNPLSMLCVIVLLAVLAYVVLGRNGIPVAVSLLLFFGIQGKVQEEVGVTPIPLIGPLESMRNVSKIIFGALLVCATICALFRRREVLYRRLSGAAIALFFLQQFVWARTAVQEDPVRGLGSMALSALLLVGVSMSITWRAGTLDDLRRIIQGAVIAGVLFCLALSIQVPFNVRAVLDQNRFEGLSVNPNFAAVFLSLLVNCVTYLLLAPGEGRHWRRWRVFNAIVLVILAIFLLWTGSRTGMVIAATGCLFQVRKRPVAWILGSLVVLGAVYILYNYVTDPGALGRFTSLADTRTENWGNAWNLFQQSPIIGFNRTIIIENSYLAVASCGGIVGLTIFFIAIVLHLKNVAFIWRHRTVLGPEKDFAELIVALTLAVAAGAGLEGFILAIATAAVVLVTTLLTLTNALRYEVERRVLEGELDTPPDFSAEQLSPA